MSPSIPFTRNYPLHLMIVTFAIFWGILAVSPTDRIQWLMENLLVVATVLALALTYRKFRFSNGSYFLIFIFLCLHTYAAHFTYQKTPFDMWLRTSFQTQRSYFDRVVHCAFGLLLAYPMREALSRLAGLRGFWSYAIPAAVVLACSASFEIVEMLAAAVAKQAGETYVGLQGDIFDTQKDMALAIAGALISMGGLAWMHRAAERRSRVIRPRYS